jgi:hypothetical protein
LRRACSIFGASTASFRHCALARTAFALRPPSLSRRHNALKRLSERCAPRRKTLGEICKRASTMLAKPLTVSVSALAACAQALTFPPVVGCDE